MSLERRENTKSLIFNVFGILSFLAASCSRLSLGVARYAFEPLKSNLLAINDNLLEV